MGIRHRARKESSKLHPGRVVVHFPRKVGHGYVQGKGRHPAEPVQGCLFEMYDDGNADMRPDKFRIFVYLRVGRGKNTRL
jgi:hypothetical protein